jgi:hypothetical protein
LLIVQRHSGLLPNQIRIPTIVRVDEYRHASGEHFGPSRGNGQSGAVFEFKSQSYKLALAVEIVEFRLSDGRLAFRAPYRWRFLPVSQSFLVKIDEGKLGRAPGERVDGPVRIPPVDRQA